MEDIYINCIATFLLGSCTYLIYKNYVEQNDEEQLIKFEGEKLSESEKKNICDSILNDINFNNNEVEYGESNTQTESCEDNYDADEDDYDYDEDDYDDEDDEGEIKTNRDKFCNFPKHPKLRKGYYRIRFENSDIESEINYISINNRELFERIQCVAKQMILEDNGKKDNDVKQNIVSKTDSNQINQLLDNINREFKNICAEKDKILY